LSIVLEIGQCRRKIRTVFPVCPFEDPQLGRRRSGARAELVDRPPVDCTRSRNSSLASTPATWVFRYHIVLDA